MSVNWLEKLHYIVCIDKMIILQSSGPLANNILVYYLVDHLCQNCLKVFADVCNFAIELISLCDRICFDIFYRRRFSESRSSSGSTPSVRPSARPFVRSSVRLSATILGCLVCVSCNSNSFHFFIFKLCQMIVHTLKMCTSYFVHIL